MNALSTFPIWDVAKKDLYDSVLSDVKAGKSDPINKELRDTYNANYQKAVIGVMGKPDYGDTGFDLSLQSQLNVERLASFKSYQATAQLNKIKDNADFESKGKSVLSTFNRYQAVEYNTITARARTAHQWEGFKENIDLYPNIMWLPSRSAHIREEHEAFYYHVWPQDDPFWDENQPGALWNCKCDWTETDKDVTDNGDIESVTPSQGLEGNPGETGELITDEHPFISYAPDDIDSDVYRIMRNDARNEAIDNLVGKEIHQTISDDNGEDRNIKIEITKPGIKHMAGDYDENRTFKNGLMPYLDTIIKESKYVLSAQNYDFTDPMTLKYHYFSFEILDRKGYVNVAEDAYGKFRFHSYKDIIGHKKRK